MPGTPLDQLSKAQAIFARNFQLQDLRVKRYLSTIVEPRNECIFEMGGSDSAGGIIPNTTFSTGTIWHGDLFSIRAWTEPGAAASFSLFLVHSLTPTIQLPLTIAPIVVPQYVEAIDVNHVQEIDTSGGANAPDTTQLLFSPLVAINEMIPGDMLFCTILTTTGAPILDPLTGLPVVDPVTGLPLPAPLGVQMFNVQLGFKIRNDNA